MHITILRKDIGDFHLWNADFRLTGMVISNGRTGDGFHSGILSCGGDNKVTSIKVLGAGCKSCHDQYENVKKAIEELGLGIEVEYITDMEKVMAYGVMSMPAIVVNKTVASMGKVLKSTEVIKLLGKMGF